MILGHHEPPQSETATYEELLRFAGGPARGCGSCAGQERTRHHGSLHRSPRVGRVSADPAGHPCRSILRRLLALGRFADLGGPQVRRRLPQKHRPSAGCLASAFWIRTRRIAGTRRNGSGLGYDLPSRGWTRRVVAASVKPSFYILRYRV